MTNDKLKAFGDTIQRLINGENLSRDEAYACFMQVLRNEQPDLQQGAFLAALTSKGETAPEIAGAWQAIQEADTVTATVSVSGPLVENSGTGMDRLKTFNASSAAAIVAAACGVNLARHGARALTSFCGTVDILESVGIDVECDVSLVEQSIASTGLGLFNGMSPKVHPAALGRILSQIRFGSTLNISASLANPARPKLAVRGVYAPDRIALVAEVMRETGYEAAMVVCGQDAISGWFMDELSVCGETHIIEFNDKSGMLTRILMPEETGIALYPFSEIAATGSLALERRRFLRTLSGQGHEACTDFTCLNAGAVLYVAGKAASLREGVVQCRETITKGLAVRKLEEWVAAQNTNPATGLARFRGAMNDADL
ncbi:MAG: anthranilate phosphoribosyltransferase [Lentisphaerae bacterium RIFOXYA12_FULL_48_11]|nr:MAG: anthranilate phosphoribosyltransferase [Lentisphaerae bacterium RIFOXYA12_FULL_48_11]